MELTRLSVGLLLRVNKTLCRCGHLIVSVFIADSNLSWRKGSNRYAGDFKVARCIDVVERQ
jgi:hypothetical protein